MMYVVPGWRMHRWMGCTNGDGFTKKGLEMFVRGDVVFRSGSQGWGLELGNFTPSSPKLARHRATILRYLEKGGP